MARTFDRARAITSREGEPSRRRCALALWIGDRHVFSRPISNLRGALPRAGPNIPAAVMGSTNRDAR